MSWLSDRLERTGTRRPYPVADLAVALGLSASDRHLTSKLALALGMDRGWVLRCRRLGLTEQQADEWATRAGIHPADVWPRWYDDLRGAALLNANKSRCPHGRPYDRVDSAGRRRCSCEKPADVLVVRVNETGARHLGAMIQTMADTGDTPPIVRIARARSMAASGEARRRRVAALVTVREMAQALGVSHSTLIAWEEGRRLPRGASAIRWFDVLSALGEIVEPASQEAM